MFVFSRYSRFILSALLILSIACFALPFSVVELDGGDQASASGFALLSELDYVSPDGTAHPVDSLPWAHESERPSYVHFYALTLLAAVIGLCAALFDRRERSKCVAVLAASLTGAGLCVWLAQLLTDPASGAAVGWGLKLACIALALAFTASGVELSLAGRIAPEPERKRGRGVSWIARVAVLGAASAVLYYFEVPIIPPIYKLDLSAVPALIAGFAMGPGASLGVMAVKDLIGLTHSSSMGVGELADFLMSGAMTVVASAVYLKRRTLKGALLGLSLGTLAMGLAGALANYFIMIPFYVQVMNTPLEVIVSLVAKTVPAADSLWRMILLAVVPFNLLKGAALSVATLLLYKRISPLLKRL